MQAILEGTLTRSPSADGESTNNGPPTAASNGYVTAANDLRTQEGLPVASPPAGKPTYIPADNRPLAPRLSEAMAAGDRRLNRLNQLGIP